MSIPVAPNFTRCVLVAVAVLTGCSKTADDTAGATSNPTAQAQAIQSSLAQATHDHQMVGMEDAAPSLPMAMNATESPPTNMSAPTGMARMLGQPPMASSAGGLPAAMGAPHIYHLGADSFFLDQASAIGLTSEQQIKLSGLKENAAVAYATTQRKMDQAEQDLWVLSSSEAPDLGKIDAKIGELARLGGQQRMDFIRTVGQAVAVLSDAQRKAVASQAGTMQPTMPASSTSGMNMGSGAPSSSGAMGMSGPSKMPPGMGPSKMPPGMGPTSMPPGMGMGMGDAGSSGSMGHM